MSSKYPVPSAVLVPWSVMLAPPGVEVGCVVGVGGEVCVSEVHDERTTTLKTMPAEFQFGQHLA